MANNSKAEEETAILPATSAATSNGAAGEGDKTAGTTAQAKQVTACGLTKAPITSQANHVIVTWTATTKTPSKENEDTAPASSQANYVTTTGTTATEKPSEPEEKTAIWQTTASC